MMDLRSEKLKGHFAKRLADRFREGTMSRVESEPMCHGGSL
jgi:hypothetical protein